MAVRDWPTRARLAVLNRYGLSGCWEAEAPSREEYSRGLLWLFPGVEGGPWQLEKAVAAFRDAGVDAAVRVHDWRRPLAMLRNLLDHEWNWAAMTRVAGEIAQYRGAHPNLPVDLVGYSGGAALALMAAEALPADVRLRNVVLCQAAVSKRYDLTGALRHLEGRIVSFRCSGDWFFLGLGTRVLGTMDRRHEMSAGKEGFELCAAVPDPLLRARVREVSWSPELRAAGHDGGHLGILAYEWNRRCVAPYLLPPEVRRPNERGATRLEGVARQ